MIPALVSAVAPVLVRGMVAGRMTGKPVALPVCALERMERALRYWNEFSIHFHNGWMKPEATSEYGLTSDFVVQD